MAANGARGQTRDSIAGVLGLENLERDNFNNCFSQILGALPTRSSKAQVCIANSLWIDDAAPVRNEFIRECKKFFSGEIFNVSFASANAAARINNWVSKQTGGRIHDIIGSIRPEDQLLLVNAVYFLGAWATSFDPQNTHDSTFRAASGSRKVPMMHQDLWVFYIEAPDFQEIALMYLDMDIAMYIVLPREGIALPDLLERIDSATWNKWRTGMSFSAGSIGLPRFRIEYDSSLVGALRELGMTSPFEPAQADFSMILPERSGPFTADFFHKTYLDVNERGTEAAATTLKVLGGTPQPFRMIVDRPFFLAICDIGTGLPLFTGSILEP
jgi:serine protease inhibitor